MSLVLFFFQAEDGIRDFHVTGVQTCALPIASGIEEGDLAGGGRSAPHLARPDRPPGSEHDRDTGAGAGPVTGSYAGNVGGQVETEQRLDRGGALVARARRDHLAGQLDVAGLRVAPEADASEQEA